MPDDEKQPKEEPDEKAQEAGDEAGGEEEPGEHARKHKRKGELRKLHDRDRSSLKESKRHGGRVFRRKSI